MNAKLFLTLLIALILEAGLTTIPLILIVLNSLVVIDKKTNMFLPALLFGALLDILTFRTLGIAPIFLTLFLFLVLLYQRKFEIETPSFVLISTFIGAVAFLFVYQFNNLILIQSAISSIIALFIFTIFEKFYKKEITQQKYG